MPCSWQKTNRSGDRSQRCAPDDDDDDDDDVRLGQTYS